MLVEQNTVLVHVMCMYCTCTVLYFTGDVYMALFITSDTAVRITIMRVCLFREYRRDSESVALITFTVPSGLRLATRRFIITHHTVFRNPQGRLRNRRALVATGVDPPNS